MTDTPKNEYALALQDIPLEEQSLDWSADLLKVEQKVFSHNYRNDNQAYTVTRTVSATEPVLYHNQAREILKASLTEAFHKDGTLEEFKNMNLLEQNEFVNKIADSIINHLG